MPPPSPAKGATAAAAAAANTGDVVPAYTVKKPSFSRAVAAVPGMPRDLIKRVITPKKCMALDFHESTGEDEDKDGWDYCTAAASKDKLFCKECAADLIERLSTFTSPDALTVPVSDVFRWWPSFGGAHTSLQGCEETQDGLPCAFCKGIYCRDCAPAGTRFFSNYVLCGNHFMLDIVPKDHPLALRSQDGLGLRPPLAPQQEGSAGAGAVDPAVIKELVAAFMPLVQQSKRGKKRAHNASARSGEVSSDDESDEEDWMPANKRWIPESNGELLFGTERGSDAKKGGSSLRAQLHAVQNGLAEDARQLYPSWKAPSADAPYPFFPRNAAKVYSLYEAEQELFRLRGDPKSGLQNSRLRSWFGWSSIHLGELIAQMKKVQLSASNSQDDWVLACIYAHLLNAQMIEDFAGVHFGTELDTALLAKAQTQYEEYMKEWGPDGTMRHAPAAPKPTPRSPRTPDKPRGKMPGALCSYCGIKNSHVEADCFRRINAEAAEAEEKKKKKSGSKKSKKKKSEDDDD